MTGVVAALVRPGSKRYHASLSCATRGARTSRYVAESELTVLTEQLAAARGYRACSRCWREHGYTTWRCADCRREVPAGEGLCPDCRAAREPASTRAERVRAALERLADDGTLRRASGRRQA